MGNGSEVAKENARGCQHMMQSGGYEGVMPGHHTGNAKGVQKGTARGCQREWQGGTKGNSKRVPTGTARGSKEGPGGRHSVANGARRRLSLGCQGALDAAAIRLLLTQRRSYIKI